MRKTLRVRLVPTQRTDLLCIGCGQFRTQLAIVLGDESEEHAQAGIHKACVGGKPRPRRTSKRVVVDDAATREREAEDALVKELLG